MSQDKGRINSLILESAWQRYAEFKTNATATTRRRVFFVQTAIILAMVSVILAVLIDTEIQFRSSAMVSDSLSKVLVVILIIDFIALALAIRHRQPGSTQALRSAAPDVVLASGLTHSLLL